MGQNILGQDYRHRGYRRDLTHGSVQASAQAEPLPERPEQSLICPGDTATPSSHSLRGFGVPGNRPSAAQWIVTGP